MTRLPDEWTTRMMWNGGFRYPNHVIVLHVDRDRSSGANVATPTHSRSASPSTQDSADGDDNSAPNGPRVLHLPPVIDLRYIQHRIDAIRVHWVQKTTLSTVIRRVHPFL